ncbi:MAG: DUF2341 domain-containing protein [Kiritimatiellae bacterium]|nr:DUF2341 domain-containing protein [Kiritimatiellia bacterium]
MKIKNVILSLAAAVALVANGGQKVIKNGDTLVFMGDSITQFGKDTVDGYLRLVVQGLAANNINVTWYGVGISGQTAVQMKNRFQNDVVAKNPNVCTIFAGVNDCGSNWPTNTASTPDDVAAMADMAIAAGITPVLLSPTGVNGEGFKENVRDYAAAVKSIATARNIPYAETYEAFRACVEDAANPVINQFGHKATKDGTHMDVVGNRIIAREVLKAFGFDSTEMANAEAAWNANAPFIEFHPSVQITEQEYMAVKAAAGRAGKSLGEYHKDLFYRGAELMKQNPVKVTATSGATVKLSATPLASLVTYDQMIDCGRAMSTHDSVPAIANYAMLAAVHELPAATASDLPTEPVHAVNTSVFSKQVEFTVSGYTGASTLSDFPVAVRIAAGSPSGFSYSDMANSANGSELRFADAAGNSLSYEIEQWNANGASLVWVKMPSLSQGAKFTMYYGGTPADAVESRWTWKADYVGVWHMAEASGTVSDSVNGLDAEPIGAAAATQQVAADGVFGKGRVNSANNASYQGQSMLKVADSTLLDVGSDFTMSAWVKMTALTTVDGLARFASRNRGGGYAPDWELALPSYTTLNGYAGSLTAVSSTVPSAENTWVHIAAVFNGTTLTTYANGVKLADASITAVQDTDNKLIFGAKDKDVVQGHFTGLFDEFRLRDAVSSADWVKAEYAQSSASFLTAGAATAVSGGGFTPDPQPQGDPEGAITASGDTTGASDLSAIQAAINATANGGTVTLGSGTFYINAQLTVANGVTLAGQGWERTIIKQVSSGDNMRVATIQGGATVKNATLTGGRFVKDATYQYGGGVLVNNGTISWCCITNNSMTCKNVAIGGGVAFTGPGQIDHSIVADNHVVSTYEDVNVGGGIGANQVSGAITIDTCLISGNSAINATQHRNGKGGGIGAISMWGTTMTVRNTTIVGNAAGGSGGVNNNSKGGAVYAEGDSGKKLTMVNCVFASNTTVNGSNMDLAYAGGVDYCLFDDSADKIGTNSKSGDPKFTNAAAGDYTIASDSPAKAAGTAYSGIGKDLSNNDFAATPSMGCYEFGSTSGGGSGGDPIVDPPAPHTHTWGAPTYVWSSGNATCTASATCTADSSHTTNKTVTAVYTVVVAATATTDGTGRYTATFDAPFATQTKDVVLPKTGGGSTPDPQPHVDPEGALAPSNDTTGANDLSAIQALINAAAPTHGTVTLGSGTFYINAQLMVTNGVTLEGQGWERTIIKQVGSERVATLSGDATLEGVTMTGGKITADWNHGGGLYVESGTISWCCVSNNTASGKGAYGGGVFIKQGAIDHSLIAFNTNDGNGGKGAGIGVNGDYTGPITIDACMIRGNRAVYAWGASKGAGIGMELKQFGSAVAIRNTTIVENVSGVDGRASEGGALSVGSDYSGKLTMVNCIIAGNTTVGGNPDVKLHHATNVDYCLFDTASCVTIETSGEQVGSHCKTGDAKFTDAAAGDYTLGADSPAKCAGTAYSGIGKDLMGCDFANPPSMGCYEFGSVPPTPSIALGAASARPLTDYNGSAVEVAFTGSIPDGAVVAAKVTIGGINYVGTVDAANGVATFSIPSGVVTAGNVYVGTITLTVDGVDYTKSVDLVQGTIKVDEDANWIHETAAALGSTGVWSGDKATAANGKISVSNATFAATTAAPRAAVVTVSSTFEFGSPSASAFETTSRAGVMVVSVGGVNRYAVLTANGAVTNLSVVANTASPVNVVVTLNDCSHTVSYSVGGVNLGTYAMAEKSAGITTVRYIGATDVTSLDGAYRFEGLDSNLAKVGGTEYETVADALAAGNGQAELLWDASWNPAVVGNYTITTNGHALVVGGSLAYLVTDNGNGTITVSVSGGSTAETPAVATVKFVGSTVKVGVSEVTADYWYALEKTTDLSKPFVLDETTWTKGSALAAGEKELMISRAANETQAFYRVVVSTTAP